MNVFARESGDVCKIWALIYFHISDWKKHILKSLHIEIVLIYYVIYISELVTKQPSNQPTKPGGGKTIMHYAKSSFTLTWTNKWIKLCRNLT